MNPKRNIFGLLAVAILIVMARSAIAQNTAPAAPAPPTGLTLPRITIDVGRAETPDDVTTTLNLFVIITVLSIAPAILVLMTSFTRIIVVLGFLRQALATQQMPPNQVLVGLALFLTMFVMAPVWQRVYVDAYQPYRNGQLSTEDAFNRAMTPLREFMLRQTRERDLMLFVRLAKIERPRTYQDIPTYVVVPSYVISELRTAFEIGFMIYVPFLIIDMVVASTLMAMGMLMLPPIFISLPFKVVMFVLADGWYRLVGSLVESFH